MEEKWLAPARPADDHMKVFHVFMLAVAEEYTGKGLATYLVDASTKLAQDKRFTVAIAEATGLGSQTVFRRLGYIERKECHVEYSQFQAKDGTCPFQGLTATHFMMMEKSL